VPSKIYVGNMSYSTTEEELRGLFAQYGEVVSVNVVYDRATERPRGFAFVEMNTAESAESAIAALDGKEFGGRQLRVNAAKPQAGGGGRGGGRGGYGGGRGGGGGGRDSYEFRSYFVRDEGRRRRSLRHEG